LFSLSDAHAQQLCVQQSQPCVVSYKSFIVLE